MSSKAVKIWYWITTIVFAAFMLYSGIASMMQTPAGVEVMTHLGYPAYLNTILGIAKVLGALAILQWKWKTLKEWAYAGFTFDILGASLSMFFTGDAIGMSLFPLVFFVVMIPSYCLWKKTLRA